MSSSQTPERLQLGFVRGVSPSRLADRWNSVPRRRRLGLLPVDAHFDARPEGADLTLVRAMPGEYPDGSRGDARERHAVQLYEEAVALVIDVDHDLGGLPSLEADNLDLVRLLDHPAHHSSWPSPEPWADPSWKPTTLTGALELVATGLGGILMSFPLARHLIDKKRHRVIRVAGDLAGTRVFAVWDLARDDAEIQELVGVLRGRTSRSSR